MRYNAVSLLSEGQSLGDMQNAMRQKVGPTLAF